jgi:hypothetical protein
MGILVEEKNKTWQKREENSIQTKGAGTWEEFLQLKAKPVATGKYRIQWYAQVRMPTAGSTQPRLRVRYDDTSTLGAKCFKGADNEWDETSGWDFKTLIEGEKPKITIECKGQGGSETIELRRLKLSIELMEE